LLLSFVPVIVMFWFSYGLMNRFDRTLVLDAVEEVRQDTALMAELLSKYAAENAQAEAVAMAASPAVKHGFEGHSFAGALEDLRAHEPTLQGGFAVALDDGGIEAASGSLQPWSILKPGFRRGQSTLNIRKCSTGKTEITSSEAHP